MGAKNFWGHLHVMDTCVGSGYLPPVTWSCFWQYGHLALLFGQFALIYVGQLSLFWLLGVVFGNLLSCPYFGQFGDGLFWVLLVSWSYFGQFPDLALVLGNSGILVLSSSCGKLLPAFSIPFNGPHRAVSLWAEE